MSAPSLRVDAPLEKLQRLRELQTELHGLEDAKRERWRRDPVAWIEERLGEHAWSKQSELLLSVVENKLTSCQSSHGTGKSHSVSRLVGYYLDNYPPGDFFIVTTAPTWPQVRAIIWRYIAQMASAHDLPGYVTQNAEWKIGTELVAFGRKPSDHNQQGMQGQHGRRGVIAIIDEASGVPDQIWNAVDSMATTAESRIVAVGNPDSISSRFHKVCTTEPGWNRIKISSFDTPAFTGEQVPDDVARGLVQREWVEDKARRWGVDSPLYRVKVLGEFADSEDGLIPLSWVIAANNRWAEWNDRFDGTHEPHGRKVFGVDVARFGDDRTAIAKRQGDVVYSVETFSKLDTTQTSGLVEARLRGTVQGLAVVDVVGVGAGVVDQLRRAGCKVRAFNGANTTKRMDASGAWKMANCLVGDDRAIPVGDLRRIYRAPYQGPLLDVEMASGDKFTATPNHKVLTDRGWAAVKTLRLGDKLVDASLSNPIDSGSVGPEVHNVPPKLSELYRSAARLFGSERVQRGAVNFHGDSPSGEVDVVTVNRHLLSVDPPGRQEAHDVQLLHLLIAQGRLALQRSTTHSFRMGYDRLRESSPFPGDNVPSGPLGPLSKREPLDVQSVGLGVPAQRASCILNGATDGSRMNAEGFGDPLNGLSSQVATHGSGFVNLGPAGERRGFLRCSLSDVTLVQCAANGVSVGFHGLSERVDGLASQVASGNFLCGELEREGGASRLPLSANTNPLHFEDQLDPTSVGPELLTQGEQGLSGLVPLDEVVSIQIRLDTLHRDDSFVYTLETSTGTYSTSNTLHKNCRVASWYNLRELLDPALGASLCLPPDDDLTADLTAPTYEPRAGGNLWVEDKLHVRQRLGHSPDLGDAVAMACWVEKFPRADDEEREPLRPIAYASASDWG